MNGFFDLPEVPYHKLNTFGEYDKFVDKFKPKLTTDDCYTPQPVYDAIKDWVFKRWNLPADTQVLRPFKPGGDFEHEDYPEGCLVLDNPPFSLYAHITRWYLSKGVRFFIFGPYLTGLVMGADVTYVVANKSIVYENGASVATCFCTNLPSDDRLILSTDLFHAIGKANNEFTQARTSRKLEYPKEVINLARIGRLIKGDAEPGHEFTIKKNECIYIRKFDCGQDIFGNGLLLSDVAAERLAAERLAAERLAAERLAAERLAAERLAEYIPLSKRERELQQSIGKDPAPPV